MLPPAIRPMMSDMLTVSLFTAIVLTLLFRIGIRERCGSSGAIRKGLREPQGPSPVAPRMKLDSHLIGRAADTVDNAVRHGREGESNC